MAEECAKKLVKRRIFTRYDGVRGELEGLQAVVTVCTALGFCGKIVRGVAVLGDGDVPDIDKGKQVALNYAIRGLKGRKSVKITDDRAMKVVLQTECPFTLHCDIAPVLTFQERVRLLKKDVDKYREPIVGVFAPPTLITARDLVAYDSGVIGMGRLATPQYTQISGGLRR